MLSYARNLLVLAAAVGLCGGCESPRVYPLTDFEYMPKRADAPIDLFIGKLSRPYEAIALVDSERSEEKDDFAKERMLEDLKVRARRLGGDSVQNIRLLPVRIRGMVADDRVPIPGAVTQGRTTLYFLRGEVIRYVEAMGRPPSLFQHKPETDPARDEAEPPEAREPELAEEVHEALPPDATGREPSMAEDESAAPAIRATPQSLRLPSLAEDEEMYEDLEDEEDAE